MPRQARSNPLALAVLVTLYEKPAHPYQVAQTLRERAKQESVRLNYGSLYAVVEALEKRGLIRATASVREGKRPERTIYEITDSGSTEMIDWLTELLAVPAKEYPAFMAGLSFIGALTPEDAIASLRLRAEALSFKLAQQRGGLKTAQEMGLPRLFMIEAEFEESQMASELHFVTALVKEFESGDFDGLEIWRAFHTEGYNPFEGVTFTATPEPN
jgi:DNA-binding PadR family transcriptional regulator